MKRLLIPMCLSIFFFLRLVFCEALVAVDLFCGRADWIGVELGWRGRFLAFYEGWDCDFIVEVLG